MRDARNGKRDQSRDVALDPSEKDTNALEEMNRRVMNGLEPGGPAVEKDIKWSMR